MIVHEKGMVYERHCKYALKGYIHQIGFDVKYDLRHEARLIAGGN
jgi:hypothetical protein